MNKNFRRLQYKMKNRCGRLVLLLILTVFPVAAQQTKPDPSLQGKTIQRHQRITQVETPGRRIELTTLKGSVLFVAPGLKTNKAVPLIIHFHGAPWLVQFHTARHLPNAALITVNLGAGSRAYGRPFEQAETFQSLINEAEKTINMKRGWSSITLVGFSAGYGAVRAILRQDENFRRIDNVLLLDGIHAGYVPEGKLLAEGGTINYADLDSFIKFAREAADGKKSFAITHSQIFPGTYASTTECADYLLTALGLRRRRELRSEDFGMKQLGKINKKGFRIRSYAGDTAPDHIDYLYAMPVWFRLLSIK